MIELLTILTLAIINSFVIIGVYESTQCEVKNVKVWDGEGCDGIYHHYEKVESKMFFWWVRYYGDKILGKFWNKPFYACCTCMSSVHSTYVYWGYFAFVGNITNTHVWVYPAYILLLAGVTTAIANKIY